jgi:uncharacterized membrane protein
MTDSRHHNPKASFIRSPMEKAVLWICECLVMIGVYYFLSDFGGVHILAYYGKYPRLLAQFKLGFWLSLFVALILAKLFKRSAAILGGMIGETLVEFIKYQFVHPTIIGVVGCLILIESLRPYKGGEYHKATYLFKQMIFSLVAIIISLIVLYFTFTYQESVVFQEDFPQSAAQGYLSLIFLTHGLFNILPLWISFWLIDRKLVHYFPLSKEDEEILKNENQDQVYDPPTQHSEVLDPTLEKIDLPESIPQKSNFEDSNQKFDQALNSPQSEDLNQELSDLNKQIQEYRDEIDDFIFPQPGELYTDALSHHPLDADEHTIVIMIGRVRVYLCTRCTAMLLGVMLTVLSLKIAFDFNGYGISPEWALFLIIVLPIFPLTDWGLQALYIRKATTTSRLITGFILGMSMQILNLTDSYRPYVLIIVGFYFVVFGLLSRARKIRSEGKEIEEALEEKVSGEEKSNE